MGNDHLTGLTWKGGYWSSVLALTGNSICGGIGRDGGDREKSASSSTRGWRHRHRGGRGGGLPPGRGQGGGEKQGVNLGWKTKDVLCGHFSWYSTRPLGAPPKGGVSSSRMPRVTLQWSDKTDVTKTSPWLPYFGRSDLLSLLGDGGQVVSAGRSQG